MRGPLLAAGGLDAARQLGLVEAVRAALPAAADPAVYAVTQLGDTWFLLVALALFVWYGEDRRRGVMAVGLALAALALVVALKATFALGRPPAHLRAYPVDGYGFPSGHALGATVAWGAMAWLGGRWTRRRRLAVAVPVVAAIGLSRVLLGVHYLGSVLAGVALGAALLAGTLRFARGDPLRVFAVAAAAAVFATVAGLTGDGPLAANAAADGVTGLGGAVGGALAWSHLDVEGAVHPAAAVGGLAAFGGLFAAADALGPPLAVLFVVDALVVAGLLAVPAIERTVRERLDAGAGPAQKVSR